jgi:hypothetical protein
VTFDRDDLCDVLRHIGSIALGAFICAVIVACGGSSSNYEPIEAPIVAPAKSPIHLCLDGDSVQAWNPHAGLFESLPAGSTIQNFGYPGLTAIQRIYGVQQIGVAPFAYTLASNGCTHIVSNFGINDAVKLGTDPDNWESIMLEMSSMAASSGVQFYWQQPNPISHSANGLLEQYASKATGSVIPVWTAFASRNWQGELMSDSLHPNEQGYALITSLIIDALKNE